jgi:pseudouridine-5'-phosphate glycosidase
MVCRVRTNLRIAREIEEAVRSGGAVPATIAIIGGEPHVGLDDAALRRVAEGDAVVKVSVRDVAVLGARGGDGSTTVASTAHLAAAAGITVFATGGLGGVHRGARDSWDESADLMTLSRTGVLVVCAGVKSILDVGATLERLESLNVAVIGYRTDRFPGFYLADSGHPVGWRVETPAQAADILRAGRRLGTQGYGLVLANPIAPGDEIDRALHDRVLAAGLTAAETQGVRGKDVTPFLLDFFHRETHGASIAANVALVLSNARLAAEVAAALATDEVTG